MQASTPASRGPGDLPARGPMRGPSAKSTGACEFPGERQPGQPSGEPAAPGASARPNPGEVWRISGWTFLEFLFEKFSKYFSQISVPNFFYVC